MSEVLEGKRIAIFGSGYLGTALAERLLVQGALVSALTRNEAKAAALKTLGVQRVIVADLDNHGWHASLSEPHEALVNCVSSAGGGLAGYQKSYVAGMVSVIQWARQQPSLRRAVYTSSTSVYPQDGGVWVDERADCREAPPTGRLLLQSEKLLMNEIERYTPFVLRLAGIYGPGRTFMLDQIRNATSGTIPGHGNYHLNLIHRDDAVAAMETVLKAAEPQAGGIFNVADGAPASKAEAVAWLAGELGVPVPTFNPEQVSERLKRRGGTMPDRRISSEKLSDQLNWKPKFSDFRAGYRDLLKPM